MFPSYIKFLLNFTSLLTKPASYSCMRRLFFFILPISSRKYDSRKECFNGGRKVGEAGAHSAEMKVWTAEESLVPLRLKAFCALMWRYRLID